MPRKYREQLAWRITGITRALVDDRYEHKYGRRSLLPGQKRSFVTYETDPPSIKQDREHPTLQ
jgi:hypothetical protein